MTKCPLIYQLVSRVLLATGLWGVFGGAAVACQKSCAVSLMGRAFFKVAQIPPGVYRAPLLSNELPSAFWGDQRIQQILREKLGEGETLIIVIGYRVGSSSSSLDLDARSSDQENLVWTQTEKVAPGLSVVGLPVWIGSYQRSQCGQAEMRLRAQ